MRKASIAILISISALLIAWDILAYVIGGTRSTISVIVHDWASDYLIIPFALGVLAGHVLWPLYRRPKK